jgi:sugar transferase EpsL
MKLVKRLLDLFVTIPCLVLGTPLLLILSILIRVKLGAPILFQQERPGLHGQPFMMYKFRTMTDDRDSDGELLPDDKRFTKFGKLLRSTSLDELPELFNVLKGEMSLVGPRPLLMRYLNRYSPEQARRHEAKPGITGWAQVNGRNAISWKKKFELDVWYVDNNNLLVDIKILFLTIKKVLIREGISQADHPTMREFYGDDHDR